MSTIVNAMPRYDHRQHVLSDWLAELDQRFQLGEVGKDTNRITWRQLLIGATGSSILSSLGEDATWDDAKGRRTKPEQHLKTYRKAPKK